MNKFIACMTSIFLFVLASEAVQAHNKVVVIPLSGGEAQNLHNIVTVAKANGDFTDPVAAMNSISDATRSNPYLIVIGPGEYDLGSVQLNIKDFVSIQGSGPGTTTLIGDISNSSAPNAALVTGASSTTFSELSIKNVGTSSHTYRIGFYADHASPGLVNVSSSVSGVGGSSHIAIYLSNSNASLTFVLASASGANNWNTGLNITNSGSSLFGVLAYGSGGMFAYGIGHNHSTTSSGIRVNNSTLLGIGGLTTGAGIFSTSGEPYIRNSKIIGNTHGVVAGSTTDLVGPKLANNEVTNGIHGALATVVFKCIGNYDENLNPIGC